MGTTMKDPADWAVPARLSPSRLSDYAQCPRKFFYKSVVGLPDPPGVEALRGTLAHRVIELLFDRGRPERTLDTALALVDPVWDELSPRKDYAHLLHLKDEVLAEVRRLVTGYFRIEAPQRFDPHGLEVRLQAQLAGVPILGVLDRLDRVVAADGSEKWYISDLKTGKIPSEKYLAKTFFAMRVYALLVREELGVDVHALRLVYLRGSGPDKAVKTLELTESIHRRTRRELEGLVQGIDTSARTGTWTPKTSPLCGWCAFQALCPAFNNGQEPEEAPTPQPVPGILPLAS